MGDGSLTDRQLQVLAEIAKGATNAEIAAALVISEETVKTHVRHVLAALDARSRAHAVAVGFQQGLLVV